MTPSTALYIVVVTIAIAILLTVFSLPTGKLASRIWGSIYSPHRPLVLLPRLDLQTFDTMLFIWVLGIEILVLWLA